MSKVYEVMKMNIDGTTTSWGMFSNLRKAEKEAKSMNDTIMLNLMIRANRLNGAMRGKNQDVFTELVNKAQNLPYIIQTRHVDSGY